MKVRETGDRVPRFRYYAVDGANREELFSSIQRNSPLPGGVPGMTTFNCQWQETRYPLLGLAGGGTDITLDCRIEVTLPGLSAARAKHPITAEWIPFFKKLRVHEMNHAKLYQEAIIRMVGLADTSRFHLLVKVAEELSDQYDAISEHGIREGTVLGGNAPGEDFGPWIVNAVGRIASLS